MTDNSNNKNYQNDFTDGQKQVPQDKKLHATNENTYWEQPLNLSEIEEPISRQTEHSRFLEAQHVEQEQSPNGSQSGRNYNTPQDKMSSQPLYNRLPAPPAWPPDQSGEDTPAPKKKSHRILITVFVTLFLLVLATAAAYANRAALLNSLAKMTMSPSEYYTFIEKNNTAAIIDILTKADDTDASDQDNGYAYDFTADVNINHDTVDSLLKSYLGSGLTDIESLTGIPLNKLTLEALIGSESRRINETLGFSLNDVKLITAEIFMDTEKDKVLLRLPELSSSYLSIEDETVNPTDMSALKKLTPDLTADLMTRYSSLIIDQISQVTMSEDKELSLEHLSGNFTELRVVMTAEDLYLIEMAVLNEARDDDYLKDLLSVYRITPEQYQDYLDELQTELENSKDMLEDLTMMVYVDAQGRILSRSIISEDSVATVGYTVLIHKSEIEYNFHLTDDTGSTVIDISGNQSGDGDSYDGKAAFTVADPDDMASTISCDFTYEDFYTKKFDNRDYLYGNITFSSLDLMGIQVLMDLSAEEDTQLCDIDVRMGAESLVTVNTRTDYLKDYLIPTPPEDVDVYDLAQSEDYVATFNLEDYIADLSEKFGVDLQGLLGLYNTDTSY